MDSMESSTIAVIIRSFNIVSTVVLACFAIYGLVIIIRKKYSARFLYAFCVASIFAFAVETVFFNYEHYLKYFAGEEFSVTEIASGNTTISDSSVIPEALAYQDDDGKITEGSIIFRNLNRKVTSVFIQPIFNNHELLEVRIRWTDESSVRPDIKDFKRTLYKALPHDNHIAVHSVGKVSELEFLFSEQLLLEEVSQIAVNRQIPFYFSGLRLFIVSLLFFAVILFVYKPLRAKTAYYLFEYKFDPANKRQTLVYVCSVILTLVFSWFCVYTVKLGDSLDKPPNIMNSKYLVDAFIAGKTNIDFGHPEKLLNVERPCNYTWLRLSGIRSGVDFFGDLSYYKGKFYVYYGAVPVVLLYVPYKLITGDYMSHRTGVFVFASITVVFLALLWRFLVKKYMPNARFAFYMLSFPVLYFVSHLFIALRGPGYPTIVQVAGLSFLVAGTFLLLKSVDKENISRLRLFLACFCFALTVGCRPDMVFASILVPAVLWKRRSWKLAIFILIPYIMVAIPLCIYNYVRFDSIFEFGQKYCIIFSDETATHLLNPLGKIRRMFVVVILYFFRLYRYSLHFPFIEGFQPTDHVLHNFGFTLRTDNVGGLINFPILFCLFYLFKNFLGKDKPSGFYLSSVFFIIAFAMILVYSKMGMFEQRYLLNCAIFFALPSLFCAYYWGGDNDICGGGVSQNTTRLKIIYVLLAMSIFVGLCILLVGKQGYDPAVYRYLESSLGIVQRF